LIPSLILQPIVENSIKHGFNDIDYQGIISIEVNLLEPDFVQLIISDNGKGSRIGSNSLVNEKTIPFHESIGTDLVKTRLELLNGSEFKGMATLEEVITTEGYTTKIIIPLIIVSQ